MAELSEENSPRKSAHQKMNVMLHHTWQVKMANTEFCRQGQGDPLKQTSRTQDLLALL